MTSFSANEANERQQLTDIEGLEDILELLIENGTLPESEQLIEAYRNMLPEGIRVAVDLDIGRETIKNQVATFLASRQNGHAKPHIELPKDGKLISHFASEIGDAFSDQHILFYRPAEKCVVRLDRIPFEKGGRKKVIGFREVSKEDFITFVERYFEPGIEVHFLNKNTGEWDAVWKSKSMKADVANITLCSEHFKEKLPLINDIFQVPYPFIHNGSLTFPKVGYDSALMSWLPEDAPTIDTSMTLDEAKEILNLIFKEFCWKSEQDKTNAIAALLSPFLRGLMPRRTCRMPLFFYKANRERAGKDYCADITGIVYEGIANDDPPLSNGEKYDNHDEEFRKKLLSIFKTGRTRIHLSNNRGFLSSSVLEMIATAENFQDRQLGGNIQLTFPNTLDISLSANTGITYTPDLANRCVFINLFLALEDPNKRCFVNPDLHGYVKEHRSDILSALYALVANWAEMGMPKGSLPFASFPDWARVCGGIMEVANLGNPCLPNDDAASIGGDTETRDMKRLFELANDKFGEDFIFKKQLMDEITNPNPENPFNELFSWMNWSEEGTRKRWAILFQKFVGRVFSNIMLKEQGADQRAARRQYQFVKLDQQILPKEEQVCL